MPTTRNVTQQPGPSPLREARHRSGLSLGSVSRRTGLDLSHLSKAERGEAGLSIDSLHLLAATLDMTDLVAALAPFLRRRAGADRRGCQEGCTSGPDVHHGPGEVGDVAA